MNNSLIGICFVAIRGRWNYPQVRFLIRIVCRGHAFVSEFRVCHYRFYGLQLVANNRSWRATSFQRASRPRRKILQRWKVSRWLTRRLGHGLKRLHCHNIKTTSNVARKGVWREEAQQMLRFLCKNHVSSIGNRILRLRCPVRGILIVNKAKPDSPTAAQCKTESVHATTHVRWNPNTVAMRPTGRISTSISETNCLEKISSWNSSSFQSKIGLSLTPVW